MGYGSYICIMWMFGVHEVEELDVLSLGRGVEAGFEHNPRIRRGGKLRGELLFFFMAIFQ